MAEVKNNITESEYELMKILWEWDKPLTVGEFCKSLTSKEWKSTTVATLLVRLVEKGSIGFEKKGKVHYYFPILKREEYNMSETKSLLSKIYNGSVKSLVTSLYENKEISKDEIDDLKKMFDLE